MAKLRSFRALREDATFQASLSGKNVRSSNVNATDNAVIGWF